eukprot:1176563-Prorocentrum_minimum.AAC.1
MSAPAFICVYPNRAVEAKDGSILRVTPESSLLTLSQNVLNKASGLLSGEEFNVHSFSRNDRAVAAIGVTAASENSHPNVPGICHTHFTKGQGAVFVGTLANPKELQAKHLANTDSSFSYDGNPAALLGELYKYKTGNKNSHPFLADMQGEFAFTLFDAEADSFLAGRDESGKYMLKQGVDKKTTGLLITSALLTSTYEVTEIPAGHFIFGKCRARRTHPMSKSRKEIKETPASTDCALTPEERASLTARM